MVDEETQLAIEITALCKEFRVLPRSGGLLDQDWYVVQLLRAGSYGINKKQAQEARANKPGTLPPRQRD